MRLDSVTFTNYRRFTNLLVQGIPETARLVVLAGPNGVGKSSFFDGLVTWYRLKAWGAVHGSAEYNTKLGALDGGYYYDRVTVNLHGPTLQEAELKSAGIYFRTAYRHEVNPAVHQIEQQQDPMASGSRRAVDADQSVSENYQRLMWQTFTAVFDEETPEDATKAQIRDRVTGRLRAALLQVLPDLTLTKVGGVSHGHSFEFTKGAVSGFPYLNLSAGEKAVFDLLLDAVVKAEYFQDALWCIDEPEVHVGTGAQRALLRTLLELMPERSQLLLASHSIGLMSEAVRIAQESPDEVAFLDFGEPNFDEAVVMTPVAPTRGFWKKALEVALADMAALVAPKTVVICEGAQDGFDAKCYRTIFESAYPDVDFVSVGNSHDAQTDRIGLTSALQTIAEGTTVMRLRDRDLATEGEVSEWQARGDVQVLSRRHIESYLYDDEVLDLLCEELGKAERKADVRQAKKQRLEESTARGKDADDVKAAAGPLYTDIRRVLDIRGAGTTARAFAQQYLAPRVRPGTTVYEELRTTIFGATTS